MYPENYKALFAMNLRYSRKSRGLKQGELAQLLIANTGKNVSTDGTRIRLSKWENGVSLPSLPECIALCNILNVGMDFLLGAEDRDL
jgi:transcriptional regulator with XRE-family HTH domain